MSTIVRLPKTAVSEFDLPRVCVATGATEGVTYHKVSFQFVPVWARMSVAFCGIIGFVIMALNTRRVQAEMPFTDAAFAHYKRARIIPAVIIVAGVPLMILPMLIDPDAVLLGFLMFIAAVIGAVVYAQAVTKHAGPVCKEIDEETITLELPNDDAARAFEARLHASPAAPSAPDRDRYDDQLDRELSRMG